MTNKVIGGQIVAGKKFPLDKFPELLKNPPHDVDIMLYDKKKKGFHPGDNTVNNSNDGRMTLTKLAIEMRAGFEQVNSRIDNLEKDVNSLKQDVKDINTRLDYIVQANNLKDNKKI